MKHSTLWMMVGLVALLGVAPTSFAAAKKSEQNLTTGSVILWLMEHHQDRNPGARQNFTTGGVILWLLDHIQGRK
jgi:hypothetical protein